MSQHVAHRHSDEIHELRAEIEQLKAEHDISDALLADAKGEIKRLQNFPAEAQEDRRICTCHPDDRPPGPCRRRYAAIECIAVAKAQAALDAVRMAIGAPTVDMTRSELLQRGLTKSFEPAVLAALESLDARLKALEGK